MRKFIAICLGISLLGVITPPLASAQNGSYTVQGTVVDATGLPVIGATVVEKGTANGVSTDFNGDYTLKVSNENAVVEVSYMGYKTVELVAASELLKRLTLEEDLMSLDEVVVIGYGSVKKNDMTGSVVAIKAEDVNRGAVNSPDQLLMGKVPGLLVTPATGEPGAGAQIRIRGAASLNASNDPLVVIDGVPVTGDGGSGMNPLASVNPNDIETYTVLKDASATAIYGSRASSGVILITTKKGKGKKVSVSYDSSYSVKTNASHVKVLTGSEYVDYMYGQGKYEGQGWLDAHPADREKAESLMGYNGVNYNTDWQKLIYRTAFSTDQNISVYGSALKDKLPYRVSVGANYDQGTVRGGENTRVNVGFNLSPKFLKDHLVANINVKGVWNQANWTNNATGDAFSFDPTKPANMVYDENGDPTASANPAYAWFNGYINPTHPNAGAYNPLSRIYDWHNKNVTLRSLGNIQLDYKVHGLEDLRANLNLGYDITESKNVSYNQLGSIGSFRSNNDTYGKHRNYNANTLLEFYLDYNKEFGDHHLDVMAGYSWQHNYVKYRSLYWKNDDRSQWASASETPQSRWAHPKEYYLVSFFGRVNYSLASKYLFTVTIREDATSRFSKNNRWGFFPSAAFAWNMAQEDFLNNVDFLSALKLRLGWGRTGQQDIGDEFYPHIATYYQATDPRGQYLGGDATLAPQPYNTNIKWETTETYNAGFDFGFLNGRINGSVDYYFRRTFDLLSYVDVPTGSNFTDRIMSNIGTMHNQGVEVALNFVPVETKDWNWTISLNGTWQQTRIADLNGSRVNIGSQLAGTGSAFSGVHMEGYEPYTFNMFQQAYDSKGKPIQNTFIDRNGDGRITDDDKYITGKSATPDFFFGIGTQLTWKNWDFGFNGHGTLGNYAINSLALGSSTTYMGSIAYDHLTNFNEYHFRTGFTKQNSTEQNYSDMFIENASFFRLDDINLGYTFHNLNKSGVNMRLAASVQNVFIITKFSGLDPEVNSWDGVVGTIVPRPRLYTLRVNINF
ncbi:MAG: TonB-dependent receptor [Alistipes sp.]|nr:TonB-dependent receptor [Alistipes sp.]